MRGSGKFDCIRESWSIGSKAQRGRVILGEGTLHFLAGRRGGWKCEFNGRMEDKVVYEPKLLPPPPPTPTILSFYKVTKEVISEREKEKRMCVVAGGERQSVHIDFGESGKGRSCLERVEFLDIIDALVEICYHWKLLSMCVFSSPLVGPISQNLYKI